VTDHGNGCRGWAAGVGHRGEAPPLGCPHRRGLGNGRRGWRSLAATEARREDQRVVLGMELATGAGAAPAGNGAHRPHPEPGAGPEG
jgi:hypothetical protein